MSKGYEDVLFELQKVLSDMEHPAYDQINFYQYLVRPF